MEKIMLTRSLEEISSSLDYGREVDLDTFISKLEMYRETYTSNGYTNLKIDITKYEWDDDLEINLTGQSLETDSEYENRMRVQERIERKREEADKRKFQEDLHEYMRLKRKFEGNIKILGISDGQ